MMSWSMPKIEIRLFHIHTVSRQRRMLLLFAGPLGAAALLPWRASCSANGRANSSPLCSANGRASSGPPRDAFVLLRRTVGEDATVVLEESAEVVGPRAVRRRSKTEARIEGELARALQRKRDLAVRVSELDTPSHHGRCDELRRLKKEKLVAADRVASLVAALRKVRGGDDNTQGGGGAAAAGHALGGGAFGTVLLGRGLLSGQNVAVKISDAPGTENETAGSGTQWSVGLSGQGWAGSGSGRGSIGRGGASGKGASAAAGYGSRHGEASGTAGAPAEEGASELRVEARVLRQLHEARAPGFAAPFYFGRQRIGGRLCELLVEEQLGPSIDSLWWAAAGGTRLSVGCALRVAEGALQRLQSLHRLGYVHNDVSPANLCVGLGAAAVGGAENATAGTVGSSAEVGGASPGGAASRTIHLIDLGCCSRAPQTADEARLPMYMYCVCMYVDI